MNFPNSSNCYKLYLFKNIQKTNTNKIVRKDSSSDTNKHTQIIICKCKLKLKEKVHKTHTNKHPLYNTHADTERERESNIGRKQNNNRVYSSEYTDTKDDVVFSI